MRRLLTFLCLPLINGICYGHQDAIIELGANGRLEGLPAEYSPASLRVVFSKDDDPNSVGIKRIELRIAGAPVVLPECVTYLFLTRSIKDVRVSASWYHDASISGLPPYLSVKLFDPGHEDALHRPGYSLLFNLSTARLLAIDVIVSRGAKSSQFIPVDFRRLCSAQKLQDFSEGGLRPNTSLERTRER
jgi:hypothetical protein